MHSEPSLPCLARFDPRDGSLCFHVELRVRVRVGALSEWRRAIASSQGAMLLALLVLFLSRRCAKNQE